MAASEEGLDGTAASAGNTGTVIGGSSVSGIVRNIPHQVGRPRKQHGTLSASSINYQSSLNSSDNTPSDGGLLPDHHLDLQRSKAAAHAVSVSEYHSNNIEIKFNVFSLSSLNDVTKKKL